MSSTHQFGQPPRSWLVRVANKWYSWTGLACTITAAYLTGSGHWQFGPAETLQAATPTPEAGVQWKASPAPQPAELVLKPRQPEQDPFKAAPVPAAPEVPKLPEVVPAPKEVMLPKQVTEVLKALDKTSVPEGPALVMPAATPPAVKDPKFTPAANQVPAAPAPAMKLPEVPAEKVVTAKPDDLPLPAAVPPISFPVKTSPVEVPPIPSAPKDYTIPGVPAPTKKVPGTLTTLQQPEVIPVPPTPVKEKKEEPAAPKRKVVGTLSQEDEIKLNAAQNAAKLKDFSRAAQLLSEIIRDNPKEYDLRAELGGLYLAAGNPRAAIVELEQAIRMDPNSAGYRLQLGDAYMSIQNYRAAAYVFQTALEMVQSDKRYADRTPEVAIRLARAFALDNNILQAAKIVDTYLASIRPDSEAAPLALGPMLLDLDRPYDALPYLIEKRKQLLRDSNPKDRDEHELRILEVLASMVRGFARIGERHQAMEAITEMSGRVPTQTGIRNALGNILYDLEEYDLSGHVYNQVLAVDPANGSGLIGIANVYLATFQPVPAKQILDSFVPNAENRRGYLMTYSSYHQTVGEYTEAKQIYLHMLSNNPNDHEIRYALGRLYEYTKEWEKAKGEFAMIPAQDKMSRPARLWFGYALLHQRKHVEAAQIAEQMMRDDPNNTEVLALYIRAMAKAGQFEKAISVGRGYLATDPKDDRIATVVRLAVARALLEAGRNLDASREYEITLQKPAGRVTEAYYGLSRAAERLGNAERANQILSSLNTSIGNDLRGRLQLADYYSEDFDDHKVIEICNSFNGYDNNNLAVLIRLADAQQRSARWPGDPSDCFATCQQIIRQSPTNVRGHLAMARSFAITQSYRKSAVQYDQLVSIDPTFTIPPRERARVLFSDHQYSAARSQYNAVLSPSPTEVVLNRMAFNAQQDPRMMQAFGTHLKGHMSGPALRAELEMMSKTHRDPEVKLAAHRLLCEYDATLAWQEPFRLERDAKELKGYRNYMAVPQYDALIAYEPTNTEALFDQGQVYGALRMTNAALTWYSNTLIVDPTHRESIAASERALAEISPKLDGRYDFMSQRGRTGVANMDRHRYTMAASLPLGDENEYLQFGYSRIGYQPTDDRGLWGNAPFARFQKKFDDNRLMTYGQVNIEQYQDRFTTRPTFDVGMWYDHNDVLRTTTGLFLENVAESGESIRQDIFRYGAYMGADLKPTRTWMLGGRYTYAHYDDDNDSHFGYLFNEVALTLPPKMLKLVKRFNVYGYREETQFNSFPPNPNNLFGTIHPYFAPDIFASGEIRVEWWHWLSRDYFVHSNQCYYSLQYGISTDNNMVSYHDAKALVNYDISSWLTIGAEARAFVSSEYDLYTAMAFFQIRFMGIR
ncbi:MAG: tetratricopeptide repeat protein [Zavarzinella sp.]